MEIIVRQHWRISSRRTKFDDIAFIERMESIMSSKRLSALAGIAAVALAGAAHSFVPGALAAGPATISVLIENVSDDRALQLPNGETKRVPVAPGAYAVVRGGASIIREGKPAGQNGLEQLAEDGNAEPLIEFLRSQRDVRDAGLFVPGQPFAISASPGDRLVFAAMFVESNDLFYFTGSAGIGLFDDKHFPITGDVTTQVQLWDAGTEVNEAPGVGPNQAPRQKGPNTGADENGNLRVVNDGFRYPAVSDVLRVTVSGN